MNNYFCTNTGRDCCPQQQCQQSCPQQQEQQEQQQQQDRSDRCCPCREDFRRALDLICSPRLQPLVDFSTFAFVSDFYILGSALGTTPDGTAPGDNLTEPEASFVCGGDNCESLTVSGTLYPPEIEAPALTTTVTQAALCQLSAIAFEALAVEEDASANFQTISQTLGQLLRPHKPQECTSVAEALASAAAVRASTVTAGPLVVQNSTILGQVGDILVMANATDNRFYFICADKIAFFG